MAKPLVAIVGRPNVGKSMLFNKLTGQRTSIVEDTPGVTRDRIYGDCEWCGRTFSLVDTGGIEPSTDNDMLKFMRRQAEIGIELADAIIMVTDVRSGVTAADEDVATMLRKSGKPVALAVNKCDSVGPTNPDVYEFYCLGIGDLFETSAVHGHGTGDLLDWVLENIPEDSGEEEDSDVIKVAIVGKPNVGKSTLFNLLSGSQRSIVTEIAGTTRDVVEEQIRLGNVTLRLSDTAGLRETEDVIEQMGVKIAEERLAQADLILAVFDTTRPLDDDDRRMLEQLPEKPVIAILNKSDQSAQLDTDELEPHFSRVITMAAREGSGLEQLQQAVEELFYQAEVTPELGIVANARQKQCLEQAREQVQLALEALDAGELLDAVTPGTVIISVGSNSYGHPAEDTLRRLARAGCDIYRTDRHGTVYLSFD